MNIKLFALAAAISCYATGTWAAECRLTPYGASPGGTAYTQMNVGSGESCSETFYSSRGITLGLSILQPARNGTAMTRGLDHFEYRSRNGFVGTDAFVVAIASKEGITKLSVAVHVGR